MQPTDRIFFFDTETAGLRKPPCEIGIIEVDHDLQQVAQWESLLDPQCPIQASASAIHGLIDSDVADAPTLDQWSRMTPNPLVYGGGDNPYLVGHNVSFDIDVMSGYLPPRYRKVCSLRVARNLLPELAGSENHQLQTLIYHFGLQKHPFLVGEGGASAHRALFDVRACIVLMWRIRTEFGLTTQQLLDEGRRPLSPETKLWFSKHKGTRLKDLDLGFVAWLRRQTEMDPDLIEALAFFPPTR